MLHQIGAGTLGPVFRAYDAERERLVAIKLFRLELTPDNVHRLVSAFDALVDARLAHPAMVSPLATGINDVSAYVVQDYVAADSLDQALREYGPAPTGDALRVAAQLAGALDFAAAVGIDHGALHPRDVLLSADETRLTGIGVARALERIGVAAPVRRPYTAPERIAGGSWDRRADVFSLAALVYELLWGRRVAGTGSHAVDGLTGIPGADMTALQTIFARALAEDPASRFSSALDFADALKRALPDVVVADRPAETAGASVVAGETELKLPLGEPIALNLREPGSDSLELRAFASEVQERGDTRFHDVEAAPAAVPEPHPIHPVEPIRPPEPPPLSVVDHARSAVWPLMAALAIGLAIGFAGGYGANPHDRPAPSTPTGPAATPPSARDTTDVAVPEAPAVRPPQSPDAPVAARPEPAKTPLPTPPPTARKETPKRTPSLTAASHTPARAPRTIARPSSAPASGTTGRFTGALNVDTRPTGARVFLDGRLVGTTPLIIESVPAGEHAIRLERDGYRSWSSSVRIVASERNRVTASLER